MVDGTRGEGAAIIPVRAGLTEVKGLNVRIVEDYSVDLGGGRAVKSWQAMRENLDAARRYGVLCVLRVSNLRG